MKRKSEAASLSSVSNNLPPPDLLSSPSSLYSLPFLSFPLLFDPTSSLGRKKKVKAPSSSDSASIFCSSASRHPPPLVLVSLRSPSSPVAQPRSSHDGGVIDPTLSWEPPPQWYACSPHPSSTPATLYFAASTSNSRPRLRCSPVAHFPSSAYPLPWTCLNPDIHRGLPWREPIP